MVFTKYFRYSLRQYFLNPYFIFWGIIFIYFWILMCAYVFAKGVPGDYMLYVVGSDYGQLLILGLGSASVSAAFTFYYSSFAVRFVTKFTKLNPRRFLIENFLSTILYLCVYSGIIWGLSVATFYSKFGEWYLPKDPLGLIGVTILSAIFLYLFSLMLVYFVILLRAPKLSNFIGYVPLMLSFLAYAAFWVDFGIAVYISPFNLISNLTYYFYTKEKPFTGDIIGNFMKLIQNETPSYADPVLSVVALCIWILICGILSYIFVRKSRGISYEELRIL